MKTAFLCLIALLASSCAGKPSQNLSKNQPQPSVEATLSLAQAHLTLGNFDKARTLLGKPTLDASPKALLINAQLYAQSNNFLEANRWFDAVMTHPEGAKHSTNLIDHLCHQQRWSVLSDYAKRLSSSNQDNGVAAIALCLYENQQYALAFDWLTSISDSEIPEVHLALAFIYNERQQKARAKRHMNIFEQTKTHYSAEMLAAASKVYRGLGRTGKAEQLDGHLRVLFPTWGYQAQKPTTLEKQASATLPLRKHRLQKGETLYQLSKRYRVPISGIIKANPNLKITDIPIGSVIVVPTTSAQ